MSTILLCCANSKLLKEPRLTSCSQWISAVPADVLVLHYKCCLCLSVCAKSRLSLDAHFEKTVCHDSNDKKISAFAKKRRR